MRHPMKKSLITTAVAMLSFMAASAQDTFEATPDSYFGIRVGGDIVCPGKLSYDNVSVSTFKVGGGIEFGGIYNASIAQNFYIEPGLKFYYDSYSVKKDMLSAMEGVYISDVSYRKFGMRIPVMAGFRFDTGMESKLSIFTGPELEIGLSAKEHAKGSNGISVSESVYGDDGGMNRVNLLWGIGAGITYQHFYFGLSGGIGLLNMMSDSDASFHESRVTFSVGYNF